MSDPRHLVTRRQLAPITVWLLLVVLALGRTAGVRADTLSPAQTISNDSTQDVKPQIAEDRQGNLHAVWDGNTGSRHVVQYAKGIWNGNGYAFGAAIPLADVGGFGYAEPSVAVAGDGIIMVAWSSGPSTAPALQVQTWNAAQSQPAGSPTVIGIGVESRIAPDLANRFHIVANGNFQIQYCQFENGGCSAGTVLATNNTPHSPAVAVDVNGNVHIVWDEQQGVWYQSRPAGGLFGAKAQLDSGGNRASIAADGLGNVHIAWSSSFVIRYCQLSYGQPCTNPHTLQSPSAQDVTPSVGVTWDGNVLVAFADQQDKNLYYDTREGGSWLGARVLAGAPPTPVQVYVAPQPVSNRLVAVWSQNFQIQQTLVTVPPPVYSYHVSVPFVQD